MRVGDFYAGAGGLSQGLKEAGVKVTVAVDCWKPALATHEANHPDAEHILARMEDLDPSTIGRLDVAVGGPPCPEFSVANKHRDPKKGMVLVNRFLDFIEATRPRVWFMENVPPAREYLPGWIPAVNVLNAADFGVPQVRRRVIAGAYVPPHPTHSDIAAESRQARLEGAAFRLRPWVTVREAIGAAPVPGAPRPPRLTPAQVARMRYPRGAKPKSLGKNPDGEMRFPDAVDRPSRVITGLAGTVSRGGVVVDERELYGADERRMIDDVDRPARTIVIGGGGKKGGGGRPPRISSAFGKPGPADPGASHRNLSVEECAALQGFPRDYVWTGSTTSRYKQVGNAVPPPLARAIAAASIKEAP